jgi:photosystem II stability/assembly factor-like uncharacterized protein
VYKTEDGGETWHPTGPGIPPGLEPHRILVDPVDGQIVYVATADPYNYVPDDAGVYKSTNAGTDWFPSGNGLLATNVLCLAFGLSSSQTIYAGVNSSEYVPFGGVYVSHDAAATWNWISNGLPVQTELIINDIAVAPDPDAEIDVLYAAGSYGYSLPMEGGWEPRLFKSPNAGTSWHLSGSGIAFPNILSVAVDPGDHRVIVAGTEFGGVFRSTDGGASWSHWSTGLESLLIRGLAVHPHDEDQVYAGVYAVEGPFTERAAGVYVSLDGGMTWEPRLRDMFVGSWGIVSLAVSPSDDEPDIVYAANAGWSLYKSIDQGLHWVRRAHDQGLTAFWTQCVVADPANPLTAYVSVAGFEPDLPDIYKTTNGGETWFPTASWIVFGGFGGLAIDLTNSQIVYAGTHWDGVYKTTSGGDAWEPTGPEILDTMVKSILVDPQAPQHVYAGDIDFEATGVYFSDDGGGHWETFNEGLLVLEVEALAIDSVSPAPAVLYAGTDGGGVFRRVEGQPWSPINEGLHEMCVYDLALGPPTQDVPPHGSRRALYAGTAAGVYRRVPLGDIDGDGGVGITDFLALLSAWGACPDPCPPSCPADLDGDCMVGIIDLLILLGNWG